MPRPISLFFAALAVMALVSACAPKAPAKSASGDSTADSDSPGGSGGSSKPKRTQSLEESQSQFMRVCVKSPDMQPYCDCGWGVMQKMFTPEEMSGDDVNDVRMAKLKTRVSAECAAKLPEATLRDAFVKGCMKDDAALDGYCGCMWTQLRKTFSGGDLAQPDVVKTSKFTTAVGTGAKACTAKIPEASVKRAFFEGCAKKPGFDAFCGCAWKDLRGKASLGEIQSASESPEMKQMLHDVAVRCQRFLPGRDAQ